MDRELRLTSAGELLVTDRRRSAEVKMLAPANELAPIASLVAKLKYVPAARETNCRDCQQYDLDVQTRGQSFVWRLNDLSLAGTGIEELVSALTSLLNRALAGQVKG